MKSQVLHTVWCNISDEAAGKIWHWSLLGVKTKPLHTIWIWSFTATAVHWMAFKRVLGWLLTELEQYRLTNSLTFTSFWCSFGPVWYHPTILSRAGKPETHFRTRNWEQNLVTFPICRWWLSKALSQLFDYHGSCSCKSCYVGRLCDHIGRSFKLCIAMYCIYLIKRNVTIKQ